jgi:hypothetical protein
MTPIIQKSHFEFRNEDRRRKPAWGAGGSTCIPGGHPYEGAKMGLLGWGLHPQGLDEDVLTVAAMVATEPNATCEIPDRWVISVSMGKILISFESEITDMRQGYWGEPSVDPDPIRFHFD